MTDFEKGDRVKLSAEGLERFPRLAERSWTVIGFGRKSKTVWIRRDGKKHGECYHQDFLEKTTVDGGSDHG